MRHRIWSSSAFVGMGWLRLVGSLQLQVSFAKEPYKKDDILQKRPIILRSLLIVAPPYLFIRIRRFLWTILTVSAKHMRSLSLSLFLLPHPLGESYSPCFSRGLSHCHSFWVWLYLSCSLLPLSCPGTRLSISLCLSLYHSFSLSLSPSRSLSLLYQCEPLDHTLCLFHSKHALTPAFFLLTITVSNIFFNNPKKNCQKSWPKWQNQYGTLLCLSRCYRTI